VRAAALSRPRAGERAIKPRAWRRVSARRVQPGCEPFGQQRRAAGHVRLHGALSRRGQHHLLAAAVQPPRVQLDPAQLLKPPDDQPHALVLHLPGLGQLGDVGRPLAIEERQRFGVGGRGRCAGRADRADKVAHDHAQLLGQAGDALLGACLLRAHVPARSGWGGILRAATTAARLFTPNARGIAHRSPARCRWRRWKPRGLGATPMSGPLCTPVIDLRVVTLSPSHSCSWMTTFSPDSAGGARSRRCSTCPPPARLGRRRPVDEVRRHQGLNASRRPCWITSMLKRVTVCLLAALSMAAPLKP
jgi:hypothetical protein